MSEIIETYCGYTIKPKQDFGTGRGYYTNGRYIKSGYNVCDASGFINVLPGATWAETIPEARELIDAYIEAQGDGKRFWEIVRAQNAAREQLSTLPDLS